MKKHMQNKRLGLNEDRTTNLMELQAMHHDLTRKIDEATSLFSATTNNPEFRTVKFALKTIEELIESISNK